MRSSDSGGFVRVLAGVGAAAVAGWADTYLFDGAVVRVSNSQANTVWVPVSAMITATNAISGTAVVSR